MESAYELFNKATDFHKGERFGDAEPIYRYLLKEFPENQTIRRNLSLCLAQSGAVFMKDGNYKEALPLFEEALKFDRENKSIIDHIFTIAKSLGKDAIEKNDYCLAREYFRKLYELLPENPESQQLLVSSFFRRTNLLSGVDTVNLLIGENDAVLEIGPFASPLARTNNVKYFDVMGKDELIQRAKLLNMNTSRIYIEVWKNGYD